MKKQTLKTYFGYDSFRPGQEEIIDNILAGQDVLARFFCGKIPCGNERGGEEDQPGRFYL